MGVYPVATRRESRRVPTIIVVALLLQDQVTEVRHHQDLAATAAISLVIARLQEQAALPMSIQ